MIRNIKIFLLTFFLFSFNSYLFAENKIQFIDINYIYFNSNAGKDLNDKIKIKTKKINDELIKYKKKIENKRDEIITQKNVLSQDELQKKRVGLEKEVVEYRKTISKKNNELNKFKNDAKNIFYESLTKIVQEYAVDKSVEMIIKKENIVIGKTNLDATKEVMNLFNKNIKNIKIK
jgi:Skp family chaperone for outer membrane proteins